MLMALFKVLEEITSGQSLEDDDNDVCDIITIGIQGLLGCQACALYAVGMRIHICSACVC